MKKEEKHKLKNYLTAIKAYADLLRIEFQKSKKKNILTYLDKIDKKINESVDFIDKKTT